MKQDKQDIVVVGFGNAAQAAAYSAYDSGAKVLVIEKAPELKKGGNTRYSHGAQFRHVHNGIVDEKPLLPHVSEEEWSKIDVPAYTADDFYGDLMRVTRGKAVPELAEMLVSESYPTVRWMRQSGINFEVLYGQSVPKNDRHVWPHGNSFIHSREGGFGLVKMWHEVLKSKNIEIRFDTAGVRLLTDDNRNVIGIVTQDPVNGLMEISCRAVVLACGGFQANQAMRAQWLGTGWDLGKLRGTRYNTGDGHTMAFDVGALPLGHYGGSHATPIDADAGEFEGGFLDPVNLKNRTHRYAWTLGIMVNANGQRFIDEGEHLHAFTYAKTGSEILKQPGSVAFQIYDQKQVDAIERYRYEGAAVTTANTIRELAEKLEINPEVLHQTVEDYNNAVNDKIPFDEAKLDGKSTKGIYPPKTNWAQRLDKPPYISYAVTCGLTFTYGGLKINPRCQVINRLERPIKGLYAAGELTGGFFYYNYPSGSGLTRGAVTGRVAGRSAAQD